MSGDDEELAKDLGLVSAMTIGIGTMIGAGIFVLPGVAAQEAGPIVVLSFIIGGMIAMVNALSVSELGTAMPKAGGAYYYVNRALGPVFGSISGLGDWLGLAFASAFYTIGFGQYLGELLELPSVLFLNSVQVGAIVAGVLFVGINYIGAKETGSIQTVIVTILLGILGIFAIVGWFSFDWTTVTGSGGWTPLGTAEILPATGLVFVSFLGYAKIATVGEEMKNPGRNLPIAIVGSVAIVTVLYGILVTIMIGIVPWPDLDLEAPVAQAAELSFPGGLAGIAATVMTLGALLATASSANASILASARINFAMGRDKIVTGWLNEIHPRFATPYRSIAVTGVLIVGFVVLLGRDIEILAEAASVLHLIVYALLNAALIVFRETDHPGYDPDFRVPLYPILPILGIVLSLGLIYFMNPGAQALAVLFVVVAVVWYALYARQKTPIEGALGKYVRERSDEMPDIAVSAAEAASPDTTAYNVMVPISNPRTETELIALGSTMAKQNDGVVHAVHVVQVPDQTSLEHVSDQLDRIDPNSEQLMASARETAEEYGAEIETHTVVSHRSFEEIFDAADRLNADNVILGWGPDRSWSSGRTGGALDELTMNLPCDFLVFKDRGFDPSRILLPTAGGPDSDLSAEVAKAFRDVHGSEISVLHVVDEQTQRAKGMSFLGEWADDHGLGDANLLVGTDGDVQGNIADAADDHTLVLIGATGRGLLSRLLGDSLVFEVVDELECSVLLSERPRKRSLRERLVGRTETDRADEQVEPPEQ
ncbi:amino acid permease [Natronococcus occultus]|uniref:Amino acid transporter n=1 Tax=Natronococcus occultus SP4 TaxID=694430 RepID=L0JXU8_9EURY|nr:amino acid permease [Natronococcus occultus]AGB37591.1 amino acid transporter [Natronococcus occultus SP4]